MSIYREMDDVVEAVRNAKRRGKKCALLIGAGCSVPEVPSANDFVKIIKRDWQSAYRRAQAKSSSKEPTYPLCMAELSDAERRDLIAEYVERAHINWAHLAIAQLMKEGFVDRVFTTNFDPLVLRACALVNMFPAVYDFAASQRFKPAYLPESAVFHLHGQHTGFVLLHTEEQVKQLSDSIAPLFEDAGRGRLWLIVGYSGEQDPVFEHLARVERFDERLYWVGYKDNQPGPHVTGRLLGEKKSAFLVRGYSADDFFAVLAQRLACFPPRFIEKPFTHLTEMLDTLTPFTLPGQAFQIDIRGTAKTLIEHAIRDLEEGPEGKTLLAEFYLLAGQFARILALVSDRMSPWLTEAVVWAYTMQGNELSDQANRKTGAGADTLFAQAGQKYAAALQIKPDKHEALYAWGNALADQARRKTGADADTLFNQASLKYAAALQIRPDKHRILHTWGNALADQARRKTGADADTLFALAGKAYAATLQIEPEHHEVLYNWGSALGEQATLKTGADAHTLFAQAGEMYAATLQTRPDKHEALYAWGNALADQARGKTGADAETLFALAGKMYAAAVQIKPNFHEALFDWGNALYHRAMLKADIDADTLFAQAGEKYAAALQIKPDFHEAFYNWGVALADQAKLKTGADADTLFAQAGEKFAAALQIKPDFHEAFYNWGVALADQAKLKTGADADTLFAQAGEKYAAALQIKPDLHEALSNWGAALLYQARTRGLDQSSDLLEAARQRSMSAEALHPGAGAYNLACVAALQSEHDECRRWLEASRSHGKLPSREHLLADPDLANVRDTAWFQEFISQVPPASLT